MNRAGRTLRSNARARPQHDNLPECNSVALNLLIQVLGEGSKTEKGESMSQNTNNNQNRVLCRMGARKLNENETNQVAGGFAATTASVLFTNGGRDQTFDQ